MFADLERLECCDHGLDMPRRLPGSSGWYADGSGGLSDVDLDSLTFLATTTSIQHDPLPVRVYMDGLLWTRSLQALQE